MVISDGSKWIHELRKNFMVKIKSFQYEQCSLNTWLLVQVVLPHQAVLEPAYHLADVICSMWIPLFLYTRSSLVNQRLPTNISNPTTPQTYDLHGERLSVFRIY